MTFWGWTISERPERPDAYRGLWWLRWPRPIFGFIAGLLGVGIGYIVGDLFGIARETLMFALRVMIEFLVFAFFVGSLISVKMRYRITRLKKIVASE